MRASSRASSCAATAATAPVRSAVTARTSTRASGSPSLADDTQIIPITTGRPASGLRGKDVTHFRIAMPAPFAGIALKSPFGEASRYTLGGICHSFPAYSTKPSRTRSIASCGSIARRTVS